MKRPILRVALPSKGRLADETIDFLDKCALRVRRENERQYQAKMSGIDEGIEVIFQRAADIPKVVGDGRIDLGITGFDLLWEEGTEDSCLPVFPDERDQHSRMVESLPYGSCSLVIAVQEHWVHVTSMADLAELSVVSKKKGEMLKVATEFPNLTRKFLFDKGVTYFKLIEVDGAAESAPRTGSASIVSTLKSSGVTLTENRLKEIEGGTVISSGACLIASSKLAFETSDSSKLALARNFIDRIEAHMAAEEFILVTANIVVPHASNTEEDVLRRFLQKDLSTDDLDVLGQCGPTVAKVINLRAGEGSTTDTACSLSIQVRREHLDRAIDVLRHKTGRDILVSPINFVFDRQPKAFTRLQAKLARPKQAR
jgi:ATP phosphoribosyltransferase